MLTRRNYISYIKCFPEETLKAKIIAVKLFSCWSNEKVITLLSGFSNDD